MEIRIIKRSEVIKNEAEMAEISNQPSVQKPEKKFAQVVEKLIKDVRKKQDTERQINFETVFNTRLQTSRPT